MLTFSNSSLWTACAQSVHPEPSIHKPGIAKMQDDARREGEAADWLANMVLRGDASCAADGLGETAPNGWPIDEAMVRHIQEYIEIVSRHGPVMSQTDVTLFGGKVTGRPGSHTVDGDVLRIYELKYGYKIKESHGNTQLLLGAIAFVQPHHRLISLEVFQPRPHHPNGKHRKWVLDQQELEQWRQWFIRCIDMVYQPKPMAAPGDQCNYCDRRAGCHALMANIYASYELITTNHKAQPLPAAELGFELNFLESLQKMVKARLSGTETEAELRAKKGEFIPGRLFDEEYGNRAWLPGMTPELRGVLTGVDPYKKVEKSPAEMEKEGANVDHLAKAPFVGMKLKRFDGKKVERRFRT